MSTTAALRRALLELTSARLVVVDLAACTFLDSTVVGLLVATHRRLQQDDAGLVLVNVGGVIRRALGVLGVTRVIPAYDLEGRPA